MPFPSLSALLSISYPSFLPSSLHRPRNLPFAFLFLADRKASLTRHFPAPYRELRSCSLFHNPSKKLFALIHLQLMPQRSLWKGSRPPVEGSSCHSRNEFEVLQRANIRLILYVKVKKSDRLLLQVHVGHLGELTRSFCEADRRRRFAGSFLPLSDTSLLSP